MKLYYANLTIRAAAAIALQRAGLSMKPVPVEFVKSQQATAERDIVNPKGRIAECVQTNPPFRPEPRKELS